MGLIPDPGDPRRCHATSNRTGARCRHRGVAGTEPPVCRSHGGNAPQVRKRAAVRAEVQRWGLADGHDDPGEVLLRLVTQSAARVRLYSSLLEAAYEAADADGRAAEADVPGLPAALQRGGVAALVGHVYTPDGQGGRFATREAIRGLVQLEGEERDRCARFAGLALTGGLAERQVRLAERQGQTLAGVLRAVVAALGHDPDAADVRALVGEKIREVTAA